MPLPASADGQETFSIYVKVWFDKARLCREAGYLQRGKNVQFFQSQGRQRIKNTRRNLLLAGVSLWGIVHVYPALHFGRVKTGMMGRGEMLGVGGFLVNQGKAGLG